MLTVESKTVEGRIYFFESLGFLTEEHFKKGLFVGVPCVRVDTLDFGKDGDSWKIIIEDCDHPELVESYKIWGYNGLTRFLGACGIVSINLKVHVAVKI